MNDIVWKSFEVGPTEGDWEPGRVVVIEFPSMEALKSWWNSERYQAAAEIRRANSTGGTSWCWVPVCWA